MRNMDMDLLERGSGSRVGANPRIWLQKHGCRLAFTCCKVRGVVILQNYLEQLLSYGFWKLRVDSRDWL